LKYETSTPFRDFVCFIDLRTVNLKVPTQTAISQVDIQYFGWKTLREDKQM